MDALKKMKPDYMIKAGVMIAIGVVLTVWTAASLDFIARALAVLLLAIGAVFIITSLLRKEKSMWNSSGLVVGIIIAVIGGWIFVNPSQFTDLIPKLFGVFIMVSGLGNLGQTISLIRYKSRTWWVSLLIALVTVGIGGYLFFNPTGVKEFAVTLIGIFLIFDGATNLITSILLGVASKKAAAAAAPIDTEAVVVEKVEGEIVEKDTEN